MLSLFSPERDMSIKELASEPPFGGIGRSIGRGDPLLKGYFNFFPSETWNPAVNLYESDTHYIACIDLAGVDKEKIDLTVHDSRLKLKGERHVPTPPGNDAESTKKLKLHLMEIDHGAFVREVELPHDVNPDAITATYVNGLLWVELPKK
jgi:HSP20 family protein